MIRNFGSVQGLKGQPQGVLLGLGTGGDAQPNDVVNGKKFTNDTGEQTGTGTNAKRVANGTATTDASGNITINSLTFTPRIIIIEFNGVYRKVYFANTGISALNNRRYDSTSATDTGAFTVNGTGFVVTVVSGSSGINTNWWVVE